MAVNFNQDSVFNIQTPGFAELFPDSELALTFSNGFTAEFEFKVRLEGRI